MSRSSSTRSYNEVQLSRTTLRNLLDDLQSRTLAEFRTQIRLFIHGGAVMILHPHLSTSSTRRTTRDIDYIRRAFGHEWRKRGVHDAEERLQSCINATARHFRLGYVDLEELAPSYGSLTPPPSYSTDWMNADPDVALPFARDPKGHIYDPIYHDSKQQNNIEMNTVYDAPGLRLISVTMFWGVALKLVRYKKEDPTDIVAMLRHGTKLNGVQWTPSLMEEWIKTLCWPMGYKNYHPQQLEELKNRIHHAVQLVKAPSSSSDDLDVPGLKGGHPSRLQLRPSMQSLRGSSVSSVPMNFSRSSDSPQRHVPVPKYKHIPDPSLSRRPFQPSFHSPRGRGHEAMIHHHLIPPPHHTAMRAY